MLKKIKENDDLRKSWSKCGNQIHQGWKESSDDEDVDDIIVDTGDDGIIDSTTEYEEKYLETNLKSCKAAFTPIYVLIVYILSVNKLIY